MSKLPQKPAHLPAEAFWEDDCWNFGVKDPTGRRVGTWTAWRPSGEVECVEEWGDGTQRLEYRRFHPDGSESQRGVKNLLKNVWTGLMRWTRLDGPSPEDKFWDSSLGEAVRAIEREFDDEGYVVTERMFDAQGRLVGRDGEPPPPRPANVPAQAFYDSDEGAWVLQRSALVTGELRGERRVWDRDGVLGERSLHEPAGTPREEDTFESGRLWMSKRWAENGDMVQSFYYPDTDPPVVRSATLYRKGEKDRTETFFDAQGQKLYSVRMEEVGPHHVRRYYNDRLVFEAIAGEDPKQPPSKVEYYDLSGALLVSYASTGGGKGVWTLHDATGAAALTMPTDGEHSLNEYDHWDCFMPGFASYDEERTVDDATAVREAFHDAHDEEVTRAALDRLERSPELVAALGRGSWARVETAFGDARELPRYVHGVLADDPALAAYSLEQIWPEIEHQGSVYPATYRVATALATVLPLQAARPAVERRLIDFLVQVLRLPYITQEREPYEAWMTAMRPSLPRLVALVGGEDQELARAGELLLAHAGRGEREVIALFERRLRAGVTPADRGRAAMGLGMTASAEASRPAFERAFAAESDPMVRFVLAVLLGPRAKQPAPEWIAAIEPYAIDGSPIEESTAELAPFFSGDVAAVARAHLPAEVLARHMDALMEAMREQDALSQVTTLETLFRVLFSDGVPEQLSAVQRRALRACADVIEAFPNFVDHAEVFDEFDLPYDSFELRQLADREEPPARAAGGAKRPGAKKATKKSRAKKAAKRSGSKKAAKKSGKAGAKKSAKSSPKAGAKKTAKSASKAGAKKSAKSASKAGAKKSAKSASKAGAKKSATSASKAGAKKSAKASPKSGAKKTK
ncbi:hypothetical protein SAMN02745121_01924 [Nannocystis exedens]|uniref:Antitoxin component YwqK of the YwqJK toxin-antitoxin module n=1 Tax=Nannocystis exedens TaxID=54 RepID=A0A1I1VZB1_9BACT|nr:hypothetical protein [Nannocystis exedens]PCC72806.1 hypothetical protein NAEX_05891 [Nannocystis exedens]SFD85960.1 hypothetical protein SAMN02745121_01924 [Nannocystis exedens]